MSNTKPNRLDVLESLTLTPETWVSELMALLDAIELEWSMVDELGVLPPQTLKADGDQPSAFGTRFRAWRMRY